MKTVKNIFPFLVLFSLFGYLFLSCEDEDGGVPRIDYIIDASKNSDSIVLGSTSGNTIIIVGEHLASTQSISFISSVDGTSVPAKLNSAYVTDNSIFLAIPAGIDASKDILELTTASGRTLVYQNFKIEVPPPVISMFYSEFVETGDTMKIKGNYFFSPKVYFYGEDKKEIEGNVVEFSATQVKVVVPDGVGDSNPIKITTGAGESVSKILFRDKRNIIIDFDKYRPTVSGTMLDGGTGGDIPSPMWKDNFTYLNEYLPNGRFPKGCDGLYDQINGVGNMWNEGAYIAYYVEQGGRIPQVPLVGDFSGYDIRNLVLKFEVLVYKERPINGAHANIYFPPKGNNGGNGLGRDLTSRKGSDCTPGAFWHPFEAAIDKSDPNAWIAKMGKDAAATFYTDGWMTVSVPLSTFMWNISGMGIYSTLEQNFGDYSGSPCLADVRTLNKTKDMGDFTFTWEQYNSNQEGQFLFFVDNFRVVPDDGGGVQYGKVGQRTPAEGGRPY